MQVDLEGQVALVTGATGQLGRAIVLELAQAGADIAVNYKDMDPSENYYRGDETVPRLKAMDLCTAVELRGRKALAVDADVTDRASVFAMRDTIHAELGAPQIIVTTAMKIIRPDSLHGTVVGDFDEQFATSVHQHLHLMHAFAPAMQEAQYGRIVGINSVAALSSNSEHTPYSTAKMAMEGVFRQMSRELAGDNITVNQVAPAWMNSQVYRDQPDQGHELYAKQTPRGKACTDKELAQVITFLCSDLSSALSGVFLPVAGAQEFVGI